MQITKTKKFTVNVKDILSDTSPFDTIPLVNTLKGLNPYQVVKTMNYNLIKENPYNREIDVLKVKRFKKLIDGDQFFHKQNIFLVDYVSNMLADGQHKYRALVEMNKPIILMVVDLGVEFRGENSIISISKLNDTNSKWSSVDKFEKATKFGFSCASLLNGYKSNLDVNVPTNKFKAWNILNFALGKNCESGVSLNDYNNNDYAKLLNKKKFKNEFKALVKVIKILITIRGGGIRISETLKRLSILNGQGSIDIIEFARKFELTNVNYNPQDKNVKNVDDAIGLIYKKRV